MRRRKITVALLSLLIVVSTALAGGCTTFENFRTAFFTEGGSIETVRIGVLEPQTGNDSAQGELEMRGIRIANELKPTVLGKDVELIYADTQSNIYTTETAVANLIEKEPAVVLGSYGDAVTLVASKLLGEAKIPSIAITATNPLITSNNDYYFRVAFTDTRQGNVLADFVQDYLRMEHAAIVQVEGEDTVAELVRRFDTRLTRRTEDENCIAATIAIEQNAKDYSAYVEELRKSGARAVFMPTSLSVLENMLTEVDKQGLSGLTFIGPGTWQGDDLLKLQAEHPGVQIAVASDMPFGIVETAPNGPTSAPNGNEAANPNAAGKTDAKADSTKPDAKAEETKSKDTESEETKSKDTKSDTKSKDGKSKDKKSDAKSEDPKADEKADPKTDAATEEAIENLQDEESLYQQFVAAYQEAYGEEQPPEAAALGFDAYMIALHAIEQAGSLESAGVREALLETSGYQGASGEISFNQSGEPKKSVYVNLIRDNALVTVFAVE